MGLSQAMLEKAADLETRLNAERELNVELQNRVDVLMAMIRRIAVQRPEDAVGQPQEHCLICQAWQSNGELKHNAGCMIGGE